MVGHVDHEMDAAGIDDAAIILDRLAHDGHQVATFGAQQDLAVGQARRVQQIVDQPAHMLDLAVQRLADRGYARIARRQKLLQLQAIVDRPQRIAQFVGQHAQELVLAAIGLADLLHQHDAFQRPRGTADKVGRQRVDRHTRLPRAQDQDALRHALDDQRQDLGIGHRSIGHVGEQNRPAMAHGIGDVRFQPVEHGRPRRRLAIGVEPFHTRRLPLATEPDQRRVG